MIQTKLPTIPQGLMRTLYQIKEKQELDQGNGGQYRPKDTEEIPFYGTVLPVSDRDLMYAPAGTYTKDSYKIYTNGHPLEVGRRVRDPENNAVYTIKQELGHHPIHPQKRYLAERKEPTKR